MQIKLYLQIHAAYPTPSHEINIEVKLSIQEIMDIYVCKLMIPLYVCLYNLAVDACASNMLWSAIYGSVEEFPLEQLPIPNGGEQCIGGKTPKS